MTENQKLEDIEIRLLIEGVFQHYGLDFRDYSPASLKRRVLKCMGEEGARTISGLQEKILHDPGSLEHFILTLSVNVTDMFRDPDFFRVVREKVIPYLKTWPFVHVWAAGCSTGEEVYSLAIVLWEEGLYKKTILYATDFNDAVVRKAKEGIFHIRDLKKFTENYFSSGGRASFSDYYTVKHDHAILQSFLKENIVWSQHNLATDSSFNEFQLILCRNVLIYFNDKLQEKVHAMFHESLVNHGILGLGIHESIAFKSHQGCYEIMDERVRLYRRIK
jgi:chemotaxis protein methyltransferase CheR